MPAAEGNVKICVRCRRLGRPDHVKNVWDFQRDSSRPDGLHADCKRCRRESNADYLATLDGHPKAMRDSYRLALTALAQSHRSEYQACRRFLARRDPLEEDQRGFNGHGPKWTDAHRYPEPGMKRCRGCSVVKPLDHDHFFRDRTKTSDGYSHRCRVCQNNGKPRDPYAQQRNARHAAAARGMLRDRYPDEFATIRDRIYRELMEHAQEQADAALHRPEPPAGLPAQRGPRPAEPAAEADR